MWKATLGCKPAVPPKPNADDDWETDPDFVNDVTEKESRWASKTVSGSGHQESISLDKLREDVLKSEKTVHHQSQKDYKHGFGGVHGIQSDRMDKSAVGYEHNEKTVQHQSQKDYKYGFGGIHGVQSDRMDKSAVGWEAPEKSGSTKVVKDIPKANASGLRSKFEQLSSQTDDSKINQEKERRKREDEELRRVEASKQKEIDVPAQRHQKVIKEDIPKANASGLRSKFEQLSSQTEDQVKEIRERRKREDEELRRVEASKQKEIDVPAQRHQKVIKEDIPKSSSSGLRNKFEQLSSQQEDHVKEIRERRKLEDEELRRKNEEAERLRQMRIDEQHSQMPEVEDNVVERTSPPPSSNRSRASIGVRLPIAPPTIEPTHHEHILDDIPQNDLYESIPNEPAETPRVQVLPTLNHVPPRHSSTSDEDGRDDAAWDENPEPTPFRLPSSHNFPEEPSEPTPTVYSSSNNTVFTPISSHQTHEFVPEAPSQSFSHSSTSYSQPIDSYDYVPDEPPAIQATLVTNSLYEEPPADSEPSATQQSSTGLTAIALYEYERQDDDEISFDVNDVVTNIEQIDAGWWRGLCKGRFGLFPSNYVQLQQ